ncbi:hypothetical protein [Mesorhizobium sp. B2-2-3]|uniref:hypothetical protein n=1 Tax=Mesorhizobium sp. B2-2-3 TaxID=2589963 RepID=UPI001FEFAB0F|nr:hypothetical protein [Mesorhizobium sp. B2-2-3]
MRSNSLDIVASLGLAIGGVFGLAGTFVASAPFRETLWAIDGVALVVAAALLTMKYQRLGNDCVAAGFLTFLAGETLLIAEMRRGWGPACPPRSAASRFGRQRLSWSARRKPLLCGCGSLHSLLHGNGALTLLTFSHKGRRKNQRWRCLT